MSTKDRKKFTTLYGFQKEAMIASYCPKKGKMITLLSTMHLDKGTELPGPEEKPEVITYYNAMKGGVDTMDQMVRWFTTKRKTRRWPMVIFYNTLDISALNAFIVWMSLNKENYTAKLGNRLRRSLLISFAKELAALQDEDTIQVPASSPANTRKRKRCTMCPPKVDRKTKTLCETTTSKLPTSWVFFKQEAWPCHVCPQATEIHAFGPISTNIGDRVVVCGR